MVFSERKSEAQFAQPVTQIVEMLVVLGLFAAGAYLAYPRVAPMFLVNPYLNGAILLVLVLGILTCFWQIRQITASVSWIEGYVLERPGHDATRPPRLLASLAALLRSRKARMQISSASGRSILDSVATRIDEVRDLTRYLTNLLIFLGLLGTFYGLATTVPAVVETIRGLAPTPGEASSEVFGKLIHGLENQLGGMGTAFSSSLLGLAGSLVVGLLELFAGHGQNRFYRELEDWLSTITRVGLGGGEGEGGDGAAVAAAIDQLAIQMSHIHETMRNSEIMRAKNDARLADLSGAIDRLNRRLDAEQGGAQAMERVAAGQERLSEALLRLAAVQEAQEDSPEAEVRMRLRSIDVQLLRLMEDINAGRQESVGELRRELERLVSVIERAAGVEGAGS